MIKAVDLVWKEKYPLSIKKNRLICALTTDELFTSCRFEIYPDSQVFFIVGQPFRDSWYSIAIFKNMYADMDPSDYNYEPIIETIEEAKQICQDYLQQIAEEIVKC